MSTPQRSETLSCCAGKTVAVAAGLYLLGALVLQLNPISHGHPLTKLLKRDVGSHWHP